MREHRDTNTRYRVTGVLLLIGVLLMGSCSDFILDMEGKTVVFDSREDLRSKIRYSSLRVHFWRNLLTRYERGTALLAGTVIRHVLKPGISHSMGHSDLLHSMRSGSKKYR